MDRTVEVGEYSEIRNKGFTFDIHLNDEHEEAAVHSNDIFHKYSLIIPAYNEEKRIGAFLQQVSHNMSPSWEIIIICDGKDRTAQIASSIDPRFRVIEYPERLGKGGAIIEGFKIATGNVVGYADADGAVDFQEIEKVFNSINEQCDVAIGSRWSKGSRIEAKQPITRIILGRLYHYFTFAFLGLRQKDTQCGLKALKSDVIRKLTARVTLNNLSFDTALLYHCRKSGYRISEVPISWRDVAGSKVRIFRVSLIMFLSIIGIRIAHSKNSQSFSRMIDAVRELVESA